MDACVLMPVDPLRLFLFLPTAYRFDHLAAVVVVAFPSPATDQSQEAEGLAQYGGQSVRGPRYAKQSQKLLAQVRESVAIRGLRAWMLYQLRLLDS